MKKTGELSYQKAQEKIRTLELKVARMEGKLEGALEIKKIFKELNKTSLAELFSWRG